LERSSNADPARIAGPWPSQRGVTAIELVAALALTALIAALGVSAVRTHIVRGQIDQSLGLAAATQHHVVRAFRTAGVPPADRSAANLPTDRHVDSSYVEAIDVVDGRIDLLFGLDADAAIAGRVLSLTPFETAQREILWICGNKVPGVGLAPLGFAGGTRQAVQLLTTVEARYLPPICR
jgi:type IV pilus assembly protein PilA